MKTEEVKITPGPWFVWEHYNGVPDEYLVGPGQFDTVADVRQGHAELAGDARAHAHLIAAAPALYEAARIVLAVNDRIVQAMLESAPEDAAETAIKGGEEFSQALEPLRAALSAAQPRAEGV